jgi:hypothetical protein
MTAASIAAGKAGGYARYLESKTIQPERGDYYLSREGEPTQAPGRWLASPDMLARLGIEAAHAAAVEQAMAHLIEAVPAVRRSRSGQIVEEHSVDLVAAEYRHTTARGVMEGDVPDLQLHSHVVVTSAIRGDGRLVAVASRPIFRSARELGAYYRSALAHQLTERGYAIEADTGKQGRYFEIAGVPQGLSEASPPAAARSQGPPSASARSGAGRPSAGSCAG